jgi:hypothetical protein
MHRQQAACNASRFQPSSQIGQCGSRCVIPTSFLELRMNTHITKPNLRSPCAKARPKATKIPPPYVGGGIAPGIHHHTNSQEALSKSPFHPQPPRASALPLVQEEGTCSISTVINYYYPTHPILQHQVSSTTKLLLKALIPHPQDHKKYPPPCTGGRVLTS